MSRWLQKVEAFSVNQIEQAAKKLLNRDFHSEHLPLPKLKVVDNPSARWLGRTTYRTEQPETTVIELQKRILTDPKTLERVLEHELVHHVDFLKNPIDPSQKNLKRNPHDKFFQGWANKINQKKGKNFITKVSDQTYVQNVEKEMHVMLIHEHGKIGYALIHDPKEAPAGSKIIKTHDARFEHAPKFEEHGKYAIPRDADFQKYLKDLFDKSHNAPNGH